PRTEVRRNVAPPKAEGDGSLRTGSRLAPARRKEGCSMKYVSPIWGALRDYVRGYYPIAVCLTASLVMSLSLQADDTVGRWLFAFVAILGFVWAIDLAETKGRERAAAKYAEMFLSFALSADDKEIIITHRAGG